MPIKALVVEGCDFGRRSTDTYRSKQIARAGGSLALHHLGRPPEIATFVRPPDSARTVPYYAQRTPHKQRCSGMIATSGCVPLTSIELSILLGLAAVSLCTTWDVHPR